MEYICTFTSAWIIKQSMNCLYLQATISMPCELNSYTCLCHHLLGFTSLDTGCHGYVSCCPGELRWSASYTNVTCLSPLRLMVLLERLSLPANWIINSTWNYLVGIPIRRVQIRWWEKILNQFQHLAKGIVRSWNCLLTNVKITARVH
jgi:hypothetical protein